jgi:hypothetical protein
MNAWLTRIPLLAKAVGAAFRATGRKRHSRCFSARCLGPFLRVVIALSGGVAHRLADGVVESGATTD